MFVVIYDLIYMLPMLYVIAVYVGSIIEQINNKSVIYLLSLVIILSLIAFYNLKNKIKYVIPGIYLFTLAVLISVFEPENRYELIISNLWILWIFLVCLFVFSLGKFAEKYGWVRRSVSAIIVMALIGCVYYKVEIGKFSVALIFTQLLIYLVEEIQHNWMKEGITDSKKHLIYTMPFVFVICVITYFAPVRENPYDWKEFINAWEHIVDTAKTASKLLPGNGDEYARVGFSDKAMMKGVIQNYPKDLMVLTVDNYKGNVIYLAGKSFDTFDGREWFATKSESDNDHIMDLIEIESAIKLKDPEHRHDYVKSSKINIRYQLFNTKYIFVPLKAEIFPGKVGEIEINELQDSLMAKKRIGYGSEYDVRFYKLNKDNENFIKLLNDHEMISEDIWAEGRKRFFYGDRTECQYEDYLNYKKRMQEYYTEDIVLSKELSEQLDEVLKGTENDWDKLKKLEEWIGSFTYTTSPGNIPDSVKTSSEFLDYFMLEKKEGYCVHFATAFTLLARSMGLPARFVQGVYVNRGKSKSVMITADNAHAWPEVYFENLGWVSFEPTPKYFNASAWEISNEKDSSKKDIDKAQFYGPSNILTEEDTANEIGALNADGDIIAINPWLIIVIVISVLAFVILFLLVYGIVIKKKFDKMDSKNKAKILCMYNMAILSYLGHSLKPAQTLEELGNEIRVVSDIDVMDFINVYERLVYSTDYALVDTFKIINMTKEKLILLLKENKKYLYFLYKIGLSLRYAALINSK